LEISYNAGMEARVFAQHCVRKGGDQRFRGMAKRQVTRRQPSISRCRSERVEQRVVIVSSSAGKPSSHRHPGCAPAAH
jgi:hypothetical protein